MEDMSIDTLGYVKRLEAAGFKREQAEAHAEALRDEVVPQLATKLDLDRLGDRLSHEMASMRHELKHEMATMRHEMTGMRSAFETLLWKHSVATILAVFAVGGFLLRFNH
jgi:hypothetical protein